VLAASIIMVMNALIALMMEAVIHMYFHLVAQV
jgi:hypothetical protein